MQEKFFETKAQPINIPLDVPFDKKEDYLLNYKKATFENKGMFIIAGDQRIEHLNKDFFGKNISQDDATPEHLFKIAQSVKGIVLAVQLGLISSFADNYREINYLVKLNSKTDLLKGGEPFSEILNSVNDVVKFALESKLKVVGVGYTIYLGSVFESKMLKEVAKVIKEAHQNGLLVVLWVYPRGKAIKDEKNPDLLAGSVAVAGVLGADFVKLQFPEKKRALKKFLSQAVKTAGHCKIVSAGGEAIKPEKYLKRIKEQLQLGSFGVACGRNLHQKGLEEAVKFAQTIKKIILNRPACRQAG
ncbi:aldolase [Candidatus Parcubacteria bacterium]|nr:aldolase [Candidatus Parcubacteria bacterium]